MKRRTFLVVAGMCAASAALAQTAGALRRVAVLRTPTLADSVREIQELREGFRERGLVEGRDFVFEIRSVEGRPESLPRVAAELAALNPRCSSWAEPFPRMRRAPPRPRYRWWHSSAIFPRLAGRLNSGGRAPA